MTTTPEPGTITRTANGLAVAPPKDTGVTGDDSAATPHDVDATGSPADIGDWTIDVGELSHRARSHYERIEDFHSAGALDYYVAQGYGEQQAGELFDLVKKYLATSAAWASMEIPYHLQLPIRLESHGWHGFILQTRDYAGFARRLSTVIHHETRPQHGGVDAKPVISYVFGPSDPQWWD
jgi:hypothetical protein